MTASIVTVVAIGTRIVGLLKKLRALKNVSPAILSLDNELSNLRVNVLVIQDLFTSHTKVLTTSDGHDANVIQNVIASTTSCLKQANELVGQLDDIVTPLVILLSRSGRFGLQKSLRLMKENRRLRSLQQELHNVQTNMNTVLEIVGLYVSEPFSSNFFGSGHVILN